jgi:hypothetical protein
VSEEVVRQIRSIETLSRLPSRRVFQAAFALVEAGSPVGFDAVHARLEAADRDLLVQAVLEGDEQVSREAVAAAVESMRRSEGRYQRDQLKARIKEYERAGNLEEALRLAAELEEMDRAMRGRA